MNRRTFLCGLTVGTMAAPLAAQGQQAGRQVKIGVVCAGFCPFPLLPRSSAPLILPLERIGLVQGRTLAWDVGGIVASADQITVAAQGLVSRRPRCHPRLAG